MLRGRCLHYGEGITFWPLVEALMPVGERGQPVARPVERRAARRPEELFWEVRRLLEELAAAAPGGAAHRRSSVGGADAARPARVTWPTYRAAPRSCSCARLGPSCSRIGRGGAAASSTQRRVLLEPLEAADVGDLLDELGDGLDRDVAGAGDRRPARATRCSWRRWWRWPGSAGAVEVPPTIQALLTARLERLAVEERELLERGAVEGEVFHRLAVRALADERLAARGRARGWPVWCARS